MPTSHHADVVIIGAGVVGCSVALELARAGRGVTVVDKGGSAGAGSTSSSSANVRFYYSTYDGVVAAWESMHRWRDWAGYLGTTDPAGMARLVVTGSFVFIVPERNHERTLELFRQIGVPYEIWDTATIQARAPQLDIGRYGPPKAVSDPEFWSDASSELTGYYMPDGGFVDDPQLAAHNLMHAAQSHGAVFRFGEEVIGIPRDGSSVTGVSLRSGETLPAGVVVNAAGPWSAVVNELAGAATDFTITTRPLRQEVHHLPAPDLAPGSLPAVNDGDLGIYYRPHFGGTMIVGGTEPECDPLVWVDDPDSVEPYPTQPVWEAQTLRLARRLSDLQVPGRPAGVAALYDVTEDWIPIYDRTAVDGFYVAIGTSGNQFKNAPLIGTMMAALISACEAGGDHDTEPVRVTCSYTGLEINLGHYSRKRPLHHESSFSVLG